MNILVYVAWRFFQETNNFTTSLFSLNRNIKNIGECCVWSARCEKLGRRAINITLISILISGCGVGDDGVIGTGFDSIRSIKGAAQKGPYVIGSSVQINKLLANGQQAPFAATQIIDEVGNFEFQIGEAGPVTIFAEGYHFNEITGGLSLGTLRLNAVYDVTDELDQHSYLNILTHLSYNRTLFLIKNKKYDAPEAISLAQAELIGSLHSIFPIPSRIKFTDLSLYDIDSANAEGNAYLLALSATVYQYAIKLTAQNSWSSVDGTLTYILNSLADDISDNGALDNNTLITGLINATHTLRPDVVTKNLQDRSKNEQGETLPVANINMFIDTDADGIMNAVDEDDDNDGLLDEYDPDPYVINDPGVVQFWSANGDGSDFIDNELGISRILGTPNDDIFGLENFTAPSVVRRIDGGAGINIIKGNSRSNIFDFSGTELVNIARIEGGGSSDDITGSAGNDVISGDGGYDVLSGGEGDDVFLMAGFSNGFDSINGGPGFDRILGSTGDDYIGLYEFSPENSIEEIDGGNGVNSILGGANLNHLDFSATRLVKISQIIGGSSTDYITGSDGNDVINGGDGGDVLKGGGGDDIFLIIGSKDRDNVVDGGPGFDQIIGSDENDIIGLSDFSVEDSIERIDGGLGTNIIQGSTYINSFDFSATELVNIAQIIGGKNSDHITGSNGDDVIVGGGGGDSLHGGPGDDQFLVNGDTDGFDTFYGDVGFDRILGSENDDIIGVDMFSPSSSIEQIDGKGGLNIIKGNINLNRLDFSATDLINIARIEGNRKGDIISGSVGDDVIVGEGGDDNLNGGPGSDTALYLGNRADYKITKFIDYYTITDLNIEDGDEGTDTLYNFEILQFKDEQVLL